MNIKLRSFVAGAVGMVVAFGVVELIHGLYQPVPSVLVAVAQRIIELTPGGFATRAIEILGKADIPVLITVVVVFTLLLAGFLAHLSLRSPVIALIGVSILAAVALAASLIEPFAAPVATMLSVVGALGLGGAVTTFLLYAPGLQTLGSMSRPESPKSSREPRSHSVRSREAHSSAGIAVNRRNFLVLSGSAALAGLAATGVGRTLAGEQEASNAASSKSGL